MAEPGKGVTAGKLAINVQKRLTRAQEKVMQKLGKADETRDAAFEEMVSNFNKQMTEGTKLQKDLKAYLTAVKTMHDASRRLQDCLADMYEPDWFGKEEMDTLAEDTDTLWLDYHQNIADKSLSSLDTYLAQFPDIKARIAKRDRKMVDFDSARHHFASLQKGKKKDEAKVAKAEEDLGRAQKIFEELNVELQDELPVLWENRVGVYVNSFQSLAGQQEKFHREMGKDQKSILSLFILTCLYLTASCTPARVLCGFDLTLLAVPRPGPPPSRPPPRLTPSPDLRQQHEVPDAITEPASPPSTEQVRLFFCAYFLVQSAVTNGADGDLPPGFIYKVRRPCIYPPLTSQRHCYYSTLVLNNNSVFSLQVKVIHDYAATDGDELELKIGDTVLALAFDNPDEQDDGWLLGVQESHWLQNKDISAKGVFPENFTQKV
uniref:Myc box-dependent-interacting protein 1 n=1 Tax=Sparus aurata TaxID=8175 RepID=A0A671YZY3_SPAAU